MNRSVPIFKFHAKDPANRHMGFIEFNNEKFWIYDLNKFYGELGYTHEMQLDGVMPDEYVWDTFVRHKATRNCQSCYQLHIISFLFKYSAVFYQKHGHEGGDWLASEAEKRAACRVEHCRDRK